MISLTRMRFILRERLARAIVRISQREMDKAQRREFQEGAFREGNLTSAAEYLLVEDYGAPVTVFAFASSALLFAAQPTFEFRGLLKPKQGACNLVFLRDPLRMAYHVTPEGAPDGFAFYEREIRRLMGSLGAGVNIAIGDSSGGAAALHFGTRCGMDRIIAFNVPFPTRIWTSPGAYWHALTNFRLLRRSFSDYWEILFLTLTTSAMATQYRLAVGKKRMLDPVKTYLEAAQRPPATIFYGEDCRPDAMVAALFSPAPEARLVPVPTPLHNCAICLAKRGRLRQVLEEEIAAAMASGGAVPAAVKEE